MADIDLTVVVTAHSETIVAGPTMQAAEASVRYAEAEGFAVERMIVLDFATEECTAFFMQPAFDHWTRVELEQQDLGRVRNEIVPRTSGRYIAFLDADDLFSENWLAEGIRCLDAAAARGERAIAHPELNWLFDGGNSVFAKPTQSDPLFSPHFFYLINYYDSLCMTPRQAHLDIPYVHRDIPNGLSFQDWQFSIETMAAGWEHIIAKDTIIFKRRRDFSLVTESRDRKAILRQ
uniref:glycosyltransferase family A protein n=1 Tax=Aquicoccus sp. TaxID=2055851 RepID=UPI003567A8D6